MGLATGEVVVGTVGAPTAKSFAAIGDITNLASRLEGVNKVYGTSVILAEETYRLAPTVPQGRAPDTGGGARKRGPRPDSALVGGAGRGAGEPAGAARALRGRPPGLSPARLGRGGTMLRQVPRTRAGRRAGDRAPRSLRDPRGHAPGSQLGWRVASRREVTAEGS